jgi:AI-2 transport protein TqsA
MSTQEPAVRAGIGHDARLRVPPEAHAQLSTGARAGPVRVLGEQARTRVPELVPIRHARMAASPFSFFRGAAAVMAADLAGTPVSGLDVQLCGDAHLANFGMFASPERTLLFDINDFDETHPGPWEWDLKRFAASLVVAGRDNDFSDRQTQKVVVAAVRTYRDAMTSFAAMGNLAVWYARMDVEEVRRQLAEELEPRNRRRLDTSIAKARSRDHLRALDKLTVLVDGRRRIVADPPLVVPLSDLAEDMGRDEVEHKVEEILQAYAATLGPGRAELVGSYTCQDVARKVVGVGSVGTRCWLVLMRGRDDHDPLFLQVKEAQESVLASHLGPTRYGTEGERVVAGQRIMQAASDVFLGWHRTARRAAARPLPASAARLEGLGDHREDVPQDHAPLCRTVRVDARPGTCPVGRPHRDRDVRGQRRPAPARAGRLRARLRRRQRAGPRSLLVRRRRRRARGHCDRHDMTAARLPRFVMVLLAAAALTVTLGGVRAVSGIAGPLLLALVLVITVHPIRRRLVRRGWPEWLVSLTVVVSVYVLLLGVTISVLYAIGRMAALVPQYTSDIRTTVTDLTGWLADRGVGEDQVRAMASALDVGSLVGIASDVFGAVIGLTSNLFFVITLALFMAFDTRTTQRAFDQVRTIRPDLVEALSHFAHGTRTYMGVSAGFGLIVAVIDGIVLQLMGVPGAFVWAVLAFVTNFIPNIGFVIGLVPPALLGLLEGGPGLMLAVIAVYSVINFVIQSIIQPRYVGDAVGLTPTITMVSLVFWAWLLGPLGALLAVPLSLLVRAVLVEADPDARWCLPLISGRPASPPPAPQVGGD